MVPVFGDMSQEVIKHPKVARGSDLTLIGLLEVDPLVTRIQISVGVFPKNQPHQSF